MAMRREKHLTLRMTLSLGPVVLLLVIVALFGMVRESAMAGSSTLPIPLQQPSAAIAQTVTGTIAGRVYDEGGTPLGGAAVWAEPYNGGPGGQGAQTDAGGYYTLTVEAGTYRVGARASGYATEFYSETFRWDQATPVQVKGNAFVSGIDFYLEPGGAITGTVMDASGTVPITNAWVQASPANGEPWGLGTSEIDSSGAYTIEGVPAGQYKVEARAPGYVREYYRDKDDWSIADVITVAVGATTGNVNFTLGKERGGEVFGRVVLPNGAPVPYAWVSADSFDHLLHKGESADENGYFRIGGLLTGTWWLRAHPPYEHPAYSDYSESEERLVDVVFTSSITLTPPLTLTRVNVVGRAVMPDGSGVTGAGVTIYSPDSSFHRDTGTGPDGRFRMGGLSVGEYRAELHTPWGASGIVPPPPRSFRITDTNVVVDLGDIAFIRASKHIVGRVVRAGSGAGVPNVEVNASRRGAEGWAHTRTNGAGEFRLDVAPGTWEVMVHSDPAAGGVDWVYGGFPQLVTFAEDSTEETRAITFTVETADAYVVGRVEGPNGETLDPWTVWVDVRDLSGNGNGAPLAPNGHFTVPVVAGTYHVWVGVDERTHPNWSSPRIPPFNVASGTTYDLGTIRLVEKSSAIEGRVTRDSDGSGVAGVWVHAWQREGGWASTTTDADGNYRLSVLSGTWEVDVELPFTSTYVTGQPPRQVTVDDHQTITDVNFVLREAAGIIQGWLYDPEGNLLTDVDGWAYAREGNAPEPIASAPVNNGRFSLNVPHGTYRVGIWLPPNSDYTISGEQEVGPLSLATMVAQARSPREVAVADMAAGERRAFVQAGATIPITFTLLPNNARIVGTFYTDEAKTTPALGLQGEVFAMSGMGGAWRAAPIDPTTARFELSVAAGTWNVGYWLMSSGYVNNPPPDTRITIAPGEIFTLNFTIVVADAAIEGFVQKPNGDPLNYAWAWAHRDRSATSAAIDTGDFSRPPEGYFRISVPSGGAYQVGAFAPAEWGYIQPDIQTVTPTVGTPVSVTLQFKQSNATITGTVYYHDEAGNQVYGPWAWVWAWSDDGQHTGAPTDQNGRYQLNVVTGTTWHIGAVYHPEQGSLFYETPSPTDVVMTTPHASVDLELQLASTALPPAVAATFDPSIGWTYTLSDGTRIEIPAGAMPTTDTVRISITPLVEELPNTLTARPFGYGYAIVAYENSTGNQIVSNFNANVLITFYYTEEELRRRGVSEDDLSPAYFSTTTNSWTKVESYSVDKVANRVTVQINHFSVWAITAGQSEGRTYQLFLPLVMR